MAVFISGFETEVDAMTNRFDGKTVDHDNTFLTSTINPHYGIKCAQAVFAGNHKNAFVYKTVADCTELYVRFYIRFNSLAMTVANYNIAEIFSIGCSTLDGTTGYNKGFLHVCIRRGTTAGDRHLYAFFEYGAGPSDQQVYLGSGNQFTDNTWYCVEGYYKVHATTGGGALWLNGTQLGSVLNKDTSGRTIQKVLIGNFLGRGSSFLWPNGSIIGFDDCAIDTAVIGTGLIETTIAGRMNYYRQLRG